MSNMVREIVKQTMDLIARNRTTHNNEWEHIGYLYNVLMSHTACVVNDDGSITVTPYEDESFSLDSLYEYVEALIPNSNNINSQEILDAIESYLDKQIEFNIDYMKNHKLNNYYGDYDYIKTRLDTILNAVDILYNDSKTTNEERTIIASYMPNIENIKNSINSFKNNKQSYLTDVAKPYEELLKIEKELAKITAKRWQKYFIDNDAKLIHFMNHEGNNKYVKSDEMKKICTSLYTERLKDHTVSGNTLTSNHIGYFYDYDYENIFAISYFDLGSWTITKDKFIGIPDDLEKSYLRKYNAIGIPRWQYDNETNCWLEEGNNTLLYLPEYVEAKAIEKNVTNTEIYINNMGTHKVKPISCFYTEEATPDEIAIINQLALEQNIPVESITMKNINDKKIA